MTLDLRRKKEIVEATKTVADTSSALVAADYSGLTVAEFNSLRKEARNLGVYLRVIPNRLAKRALANTNFDCMKEVLKGQMLLAFSREEPSLAARLLQTFCKKSSALQVHAISLEGKLLGADNLQMVASLPTKKEALG